MTRMRKALVIGCLTLCTVGLGSASAWAEGATSPSSASSGGVIKGPDQYNSAGKIVGGSVSYLAGVVTAGDGQNAVTPKESVGGGTWDHGTSVNQGYSNYIHPSLNHGATTSQGSRAVRADRAPGIWANTTLNRDPFDSNVIRTFWRTN